ncbi:lipoxygenase homology domain-containing protein 1-like [Spea bombifrons]|uniref:lipoxygenase homology domain-containing protein 1-like n=1 Tax=Spea bombifrons TaxID=233779 RepID=UPI00234998F0|nr:lipoxygenase homology domain-containing protein 1-like [Spea bombifrons]
MSDTTSTNISVAQANSIDSVQTGSVRQSNLTRSNTTKKLCFYKSGDPRFSGIKMVVTNRSFKTFDALLDSLSKKVPLPFGVRNITTPRGIHHVTNLEELEDGKSYICSQQKKVKPINLERANKKPLRWQSSRPLSSRRRAVHEAKLTEFGSFQRENTVVIGNSKKLVVLKNGDTEFKHNIFINKKSMQSFDDFLEEITEALQYPVFKLYSTDGRRIPSIRALLLSSGTIVAAGREPFKPANYETEREFLPAKLPGITNRVIPKARLKPELKSPGKWSVSIITSEVAFAGTTSQVYITFYGHRKASEPVFLYSDEEDTFQSGHEDTFMINIGDVGEVYKIRIGHSNSGEFPAWHCEQVKLLNIFSNEQFIINVNRWLAQDQDDGEICREFPVTLHSHSQLPVTNYEIRVVTGDLWNAGTEANVYIAIHGEYGDTGSRQLVRTNKPKRFVKGQTDTFTLEAVHLGSLHTVIVGHDGLGTGNGWYLEKIIVYDPVKDKEYAFFCHRWLDEGEDDGKIARLVFIADETDFPARQELELKRKEIWHSEKWKYQKGNLLQFYCKATGKFIRLTPDSKVDALGEKKDKYGVFDILVKRGNVRIFNSHEIKALALAIDKGKVTAMDNSGILCELCVHLQHNRCVTLESTRVPGLTVSFERNGEAADGYTDNYAGISKEFVVHVKGIFQDEAIILLTTSWSQALCIKNEGLCSGAGKQTPDSHWRVHKISPTVCMFESVTHPKMYLCIKNGQCHGKGTGDDYCHFTVEKNMDTGSVILESVRNKGIYIGLLPNGNAVPVVHTGEKNMIFYPKVIKFGRKPPAGSSVTPSKKREEISKHDGELVKIQGPLAQSPSVSPPLSQTEPIKEEIRVHTPNSHEWKVSVLTGSVGTLANVTLWVYGSRGTCGPITLREDNLEQPFQPQQEDQFMVKLPNIGKIYKIRIGHDGTSDRPEWELKWVILEKMKNGKTHYFEVNRWLSRNRDCEIVCEVPVTENGTFVYPVVKYLISVYTESFEQAGTNAPVYICIYGEIGDTGKRLLLKSDFPHKFQPGQVDVFEIEAVSLGKLQKVLLVCEANHKSQYWHCKKVIIREQGKNSEYIFNCERWLPFMSQSVLHSEIELEVEDMQIATEERKWNEEHVLQQRGSCDVLPRSEYTTAVSEITAEIAEATCNRHRKAERVHARRKNWETRPAEGDWTITIVTGNFQEAATEATVFIYVYGEGADSGPILLGSGGHQLFNINSADAFQVNLKHLGKPYKIRIGHDNSGENSEWYLESIRLQNLSSNEDFYLPVNRWLGEEKDDGATWIELAVPAVGNHALPLVDYEIHVYTGSVSSAGSESTVFIKLFGTRGDSGKRKLHKSQNQTIKFQKGQVDIFRIQAISLGFLQKIQISQDGLEQGDGWLLEKIIVHYTESESDHKVLFPCNRLLHENQENGKTEMELFPCEQQKSEQGANEEKRWLIQVKTAKDSSELKNMKVYFVLYGSEGKTGEIPLMPQSPDAECFLPGAEDQFNLYSIY